MSPKIRFATGAIVTAIGAAKAWTHAQALGSINIPGCLGSTFTLHVQAPLAAQAHCWGCYVAALGAALMLSAAMGQRNGTRIAV